MGQRGKQPQSCQSKERRRRRICCFLSCVLITQDRKEASQWGPVNSTDCARAITAALFSISLRYWLLTSLSHRYCLRTLRWWAQQLDNTHGHTHTHTRHGHYDSFFFSRPVPVVCVCVLTTRGWATVKRPERARWPLSSPSSPVVHLSFFNSSVFVSVTSLNPLSFWPSDQTPSVLCLGQHRISTWFLHSFNPLCAQIRHFPLSKFELQKWTSNWVNVKKMPLLREKLKPLPKVEVLSF